MRPAKGSEFWQQNRQFVIFYDTKDDFPVALFDNIKEIIAYKDLPFTKANYDLTMIELYRGLKREDHYTEMLGRAMTVYLIDIDEIEENKQTKNEEDNRDEKVCSNSVQ